MCWHTAAWTRPLYSDVFWIVYLPSSSWCHHAAFASFLVSCSLIIRLRGCYFSVSAVNDSFCCLLIRLTAFCRASVRIFKRRRCIFVKTCFLLVLFFIFFMFLISCYCTVGQRLLFVSERINKLTWLKLVAVNDLSLLSKQLQWWQHW